MSSAYPNNLYSLYRLRRGRIFGGLGDHMTCQQASEKAAQFTDGLPRSDSDLLLVCERTNQQWMYDQRYGNWVECVGLAFHP